MSSIKTFATVTVGLPSMVKTVAVQQVPGSEHQVAINVQGYGFGLMERLDTVQAELLAAGLLAAVDAARAAR